ncbi:MAG: winged helix-turn-helix transcriptional regulator [Atopobiaceae bacterium]|nr:winged helix-turn-helix transcriptional regulator [Atopobiaceae bacterium]
MKDTYSSETKEKQIIWDLSFLGRYLYLSRGKRGGQQFILISLYKNGDTTQKDLLAKSHNTSASLSEMVGKLETKGLIKRKRGDQDRRTATLSLTDTGVAQAKKAIDVITHFEKHAFSVLSDAEKDELTSYLDRLVTHWKEIDEEEKGEISCQK